MHHAKKIGPIVLGLALGLFLWTFDKRAVVMPSWLTTLIGAIAITALGYGCFHPMAWILERIAWFRERTAFARSSTTALCILIFVVSVALVTWMYSIDRGTYRDATKETFTGRTFENEAVHLDGRRFGHCTFNNVTLIYHGKARVDLINSKFSGGIIMQTDNPAVMTFVAMKDQLSGIPGTTVRASGPSTTIWPADGVRNSSVPRAAPALFRFSFARTTGLVRSSA